MERAKIFNGKKFMLDGESYPDKESADLAILKYQASGFETELVKDNERYFIFTRRVVKEIRVEG